MKRVKKLLFLFIFSVFLFLPGRGVVSAAQTPVIDKFYTDITVLDNGDIKVKELIILLGDYNGFERIIKYKNSNATKFNHTKSSLRGSDIYNGDSFVLTTVKDVKIPSDYDFSLIESEGKSFTKVSNASNGDVRKYIEKYDLGGITYRMYNPSKGEAHGFYLEYTVTNVAIRHADVAEIGWNLMGGELSNFISRYEAHIHIPNNQSILRAWAHGPLNGNIQLVGTQDINIKISALSSHTAMDTRFVFDLGAIPNSTKKTNMTALPMILEIEQEKADQANQERENYKDKQIKITEEAIFLAEQTKRPSDVKDAKIELDNLATYTTGKEYQELEKRYQIALKNSKAHMLKLNTGFGIAGAIYVMLMGFVIYKTYNRYDKEYEVPKIDYFRDIPNTYGPACVTYLMTKRTKNEDVSATLLNLISDKIVSYEKIDKKNYKLTYHENVRPLLDEEEILLNWLFDAKVDGSETTLSDFKEKAKSGYEAFIGKYESFQKTVKAHAKSLNFYEDQKLKGKQIAGCFLGFVFAFFTFACEISFVISFLFIAMGVGALIYFSKIERKTMFGRTEYEKWLGLKRFLKDFGKFETRDLPDMILWEKYLVYAYTFGCAKELEKTMKLRIAEMGDVPNMGYGPNFYDMMIFSHVTNSLVSSAVTSAYAERTSENIGSSSSGGGFGGGFSSGGGSFGGGGGGGSF